jgi:hypothetical protein
MRMRYGLIGKVTLSQVKPLSKPNFIPDDGSQPSGSMQRVSECQSVVFCGAAARLRRAAAKTSLFIQKVFDYKWYYSPSWHLNGAHLGPFVGSLQPGQDLLQVMNGLIGKSERLPLVQLFSPSFIGFFQLLQTISPFPRSPKTPAAVQKSTPLCADRPHPGSLERLPASLKTSPGAEAYQSPYIMYETVQKAAKSSWALNI